jgi:putative membrane protein
VLVPGLGVATVLAQIAYPLVHGSSRNLLTVVTVCLFAAATVSHAWSSCGARATCLVLLVTLGLGWGAEVCGVHTGFPFGHYTYSDTLGARRWGVPLVVGLAWTMLAWPAALVARRVVAGFGARVVVGAWGLASWDLFLDPQMVAAGHWRWRHPSPHLPGVDSVPLTNYAGWLLVAALISLALQGLLRSRPVTDDRAPLVLFAWTYVSSVLALGVFLHLPAAAAWGALGMGLVALPLALAVRATEWRRLRELRTR